MKVVCFIVVNVIYLSRITALWVYRADYSALAEDAA
jgi:hypothetical protein